MEDRDGKKPFIIPKTSTSNKDVIITEKPDSRNVIELFNDIKSCALEAHFDFRQNSCKSCDTIRNQKLQKLYNEKRLKMKKEQDPIERLAFHLITYRDVATIVANDGLRSNQLSFTIEKYLGNPKDGVHLSRRPDVLLTSSGVQGLYRFGLLVCKVLLGKGYATIPSTNNNQLAAQLHYDHHFCKIQSINKEQPRTIDDLLANSLIFCYDHENFEPISHPPQILPIAILWYDLVEKFPPELTSISNHESQQRNGGISTKKKSTNPPKKTTSVIINKPTISNSGAWEDVPQESTHHANTTESTTTITTPTTPPTPPTTKYPSHFMVPYNRVYSTPTTTSVPTTDQTQQPQSMNALQQINNSRDPRLLRTKRETSSDTIPLSPQHLVTERSLSDGLLSTKTVRLPSNEPLLITKSSSVIYIPLNASIQLTDPRIKTLKQTRMISYLELQAVKHALQQQKRLNHYYDAKTGLTPKTSYTPVPFIIRHVSIDEYERLLNDDATYKFLKHSNGTDYSSLYISVNDCFNFGLKKTNDIYIDLEQYENKLAYEQIEISNDLLQREKQLNSQQIRLRLREKRQKRMQQQMNSKSLSNNSSMINSKVYVNNGRQLLKEHKILSKNIHLSSDLLDFFTHEYKNETRPHVKILLAELVGIFIEKYQIKPQQSIQENNHNTNQEIVADDQTINSVIDMDLDSPSSQQLCDHDERFPMPTPPPLPPLPPPLTLPPLPPSNEIIYSQPISSSRILTHTLSTEPKKLFDDTNYNNRCQKLVEQLQEYRQHEINIPIMKSETIIPTEETVFTACLGQSETSSSENSLNDDNQGLIINENAQENDEEVEAEVEDEEENTIVDTSIDDESNRSRDEFVKLLAKEASISKSSSPVKNSKQLYNSRRRSHDDDDTHKKKNSHSSKKSTSNRKSPVKKVSSNRTVLISDRSIVPNEKHELNKTSNSKQNEEPKTKRIKVDSTSLSTNSTGNETNQKDLSLKSIVTVPPTTTADEHDCRHDINGKRKNSGNNNSNASTTEKSKTKSSRSRSHSRSRSKSKDHHRRPASTNSKNSSESNDKTKSSSRSSSATNDKQYRYRDKHQRERKRSSDLSNNHDYYYQQYSNHLPDRYDLYNETSYRNSFPSGGGYSQRDINDFNLSGNLHHQQEQQRQPVRHKRFNYNHQSVADHPRFAHQNTLSSPAPLMDFSFSNSSSHHHSIPSLPMEDRNVTSSSSISRSNNNCDSKPSATIASLQVFLQNQSNESFGQSQIDYSRNETTIKNSLDNSHWSSSSSKTKSDTILQNNNQTSIFNDTEKLLTMVQRLRN